MAVEPLFERHLLQQLVDIDGERFLDQPVDLDRPRTDLQRLGVGRDRFLRAELVKVVVGRGQFFVGQRPVERVARVALGRVEGGRRVFLRPQRPSAMPGARIGPAAIALITPCARGKPPRASPRSRAAPSLFFAGSTRPHLATVATQKSGSTSGGAKSRFRDQPHCAASAVREASTFSAGLPVSSCIWSN